LPIAGDDAAAKAEVARFADAIGYDAVDIGTLADSCRCEPGTPVYAWPYVGAPPEGMSQAEALGTAAKLAADAGQIQRSKLRFGDNRALNVFSVAPGYSADQRRNRKFPSDSMQAPVF
jgi:hypothetical protein